MTNAEKYKDEIIAQMCKTIHWTVRKNTDEIVSCNELPCNECPFDDRCYSGKIEWLNSEYKEQKEFTNDERKFIELLNKVKWVARDYDDTLWAFSKKPHKKVPGRWASSGEYFCMGDITSLPFSAIKSTDTEPTSRAEILGEKGINNEKIDS